MLLPSKECSAESVLEMHSVRTNAALTSPAISLSLSLSLSLAQWVCFAPHQLRHGWIFRARRSIESLGLGVLVLLHAALANTNAEAICIKRANEGMLATKCFQWG